MLIQKIFIASPGDVGDERNLARQVIDRIRGEWLFRGKVDLQVIAWDQPGVEVPMEGAMTPQKAIESGLPKPSECDIVIVLLWSRIGTLLPPEYTKPNGERYLSGTEWEFCDAIDAAKSKKSPVIWVYRRSPPKASRPNDENYVENGKQWEKLQRFFDGFNNEDGSIIGGVNPYESPDQFQRLWEQHLRDRLTQLVSAEPVIPKSIPQQNAEVAQPELWKGTPYPGLEAFSPDQSAIYFGRGAETDELIKLFSQPDVRFVAVVGASGSGKSSLVLAGLWPRLEGGALPGSANWQFVRFSPTEKGNNPFVALAATLKALGLGEGEREADLAQKLMTDRDNNYLSDNLPKHLEGQPEESELLLFCDQFEELFSTPVTEEQRQDFIAFLAKAAKTAKVRIVLTMRAEFYPGTLRYDQLVELMRATGTFPLAAPGAGALLEMIKGPACIAGLQMDKGLASAILDDTGTAPGVLPLMAFALSELFKESQKQSQEAHQLTFAHYQSIGKVKGAIKKRADDAFKGLGKDSDKLLDMIFPALVNFDQNGIATRKRADWAPFEQDDSLKTLLDKLIDARLLVSSELPDAQVEIAHESLLESWPQLHDWLNLNREALSARSDLEAAAQAWQRSGKPRWSGLPSGAILQRYQRATNIPEKAEEFLATCLSLKRWVSGGIAFATLCFIVLISFKTFIENHDISNKAGLWVMLATMHSYQPAEPEMVDIPAGSFRPGWDKSTEKDFKQPPEPVSVTAFKMGKYEVTFDQYDVFRVIKGYPKPVEAGWGRGDRPVIYVNWDEATAYAGWLTEVTGKHYYLPSGQQWEYAARGNQDSQKQPAVYPWGDELGQNKANCDGCGSQWDRISTAPVGSFQPNGFGLYDASGNVEEWVQDCDKPTEYETKCMLRAMRGGSWLNYPYLLRSARRDGFYPVDRNISIGFRLAQD